VTAWLQRHRRFTFHFTPTSCSWANAVEGLFAKLTRHRLKRGVFTSIVELQAAISRFIAETNDMPKPFVWTKSADAILAAVQRGRQALAGCGKMHCLKSGLLSFCRLHSVKLLKIALATGLCIDFVDFSDVRADSGHSYATAPTSLGSRTRL